MRVSELKSIDFKSLTWDEKLEIMKNGRPTPQIKFELNDDGQKKDKKIDNILFKKIGWLCACEMNNALFCFVCLLFGGDDDWTKEGVHDLKQLPIKLKKHENSANHKNNLIDFLLHGKEKILLNIHNRHTEFIRIHNEQVEKNLYNLNKIINVIKLCAFCDLSLTGYKEKDNKLTNYDIFSEVLDYSKKLDFVFKSYFESNTVYKNISQMVQCELLACMVNVCKLHIYNEIKESSFLTCMIEDVTDVSTQNGIETALILRYEYKGKIYERFWGFLKSHNYEEDLSESLLKELKPLLEKNPDKLIAQTYDTTTNLKTNSEDLWKKIQEKYNCAHYIHNYTHEIKKIIEQASYQISSARIFFANLKKVANFFENFPGRLVKLQLLCNENITESKKNVDFEHDLIQKIYENKEIIIKCFENYQSGKYTPCDTESMQQAADLLKWLKDPTFSFWLTIFEKLKPHVDNFEKILNSSPIDVIKIDNAVTSFQRIVTEFKKQISLISAELLQNSSQCKKSELNLITKQELITEIEETKKVDKIEDIHLLLERISDFEIIESDLENEDGTKLNLKTDVKRSNSYFDFEVISKTESELKESKSLLNIENTDSITDNSSVLGENQIDTESNSMAHFNEDSITKESKSEWKEVGLQTDDHFRYFHVPYESNLSSSAGILCDNILTEIKNRFENKNHLYGAHLFINGRYEQYGNKLPSKAINKFCEAFPMIEKQVLKTELEVFYKRTELHKPFVNSAGCLKTINFFIACELHTVFKEITKVLKILATLPIITREPGRCISTIDCVKTYLKTHKDQNELKVTALAILQIEKAMVKEIPDFDDKVIEIFTKDEERRREFHFITE